MGQSISSVCPSAEGIAREGTIQVRLRSPPQWAEHKLTAEKPFVAVQGPLPSMQGNNVRRSARGQSVFSIETLRTNAERDSPLSVIVSDLDTIKDLTCRIEPLSSYPSARTGAILSSRSRSLSLDLSCLAQRLTSSFNTEICPHKVQLEGIRNFA